MLVLSRKQDQEIVIGDNIRITVLKTRGNVVRLGIEAPRDIKVVRGELESIPDPKEVSEDDGAEFTIVFSSETEPDTTPVEIESVQFKSDNTSTPKLASSSEIINRMATESECETVRFQGRLPRVLKHNRLKEIVDRIAVDKAVAQTKK